MGYEYIEICAHIRRKISLSLWWRGSTRLYISLNSFFCVSDAAASSVYLPSKDMSWNSELQRIARQVSQHLSHTYLRIESSLESQTFSPFNLLSLKKSETFCDTIISLFGLLSPKPNFNSTQS